MRYDATGAEDKPHRARHRHGRRHRLASPADRHRAGRAAPRDPRLLDARRRARRAPPSTSSRGSTGRCSNNVRIINMSFAGPHDPSLERALKAAHDKGVVLVAAAGNAGPKSPPLYPAADPNVIAVTATDIDDKLFSGANRGQLHRDRGARRRHPGAGAGRHLSDDDRHLGRDRACQRHRRAAAGAQSATHARRGSPHPDRRAPSGSGRTTQFGAGLIDPVKALQLAAPRVGGRAGRRSAASQSGSGDRSARRQTRKPFAAEQRQHHAAIDDGADHGQRRQRRLVAQRPPALRTAAQRAARSKPERQRKRCAPRSQAARLRAQSRASAANSARARRKPDAAGRN